MESERKFLEYLIRCCENILENKAMIEGYGFSPPMLQLMKARAEITHRLEEKFKVKYGKFATATHLLSHKRQ